MSLAKPLVIVDDASGGFSVDPAGVELLRSLEGDVHVVAIGGAQRTGKSYLLSLLTESAGFVVGNTQRACTVGIWVLVTAVGEKTTVWLDTEGFASTSRSASYDAKIFALALLLSSCFLYNSRGTIDSTAIADLSLVCELTKTIHVASHGAEETGVQFAEYFPSFLWVVRDFTLAIVDPKTLRPRTAKWYIDDAWKEKKGQGQGPSNMVRRALRAFFPAKDCATCVTPIVDEQKLQRLAEIPLSELRPEFQKDVDTLRRKLGDLLATPKQLYGRNLTGSNLATLAEDYVEALNSGGVPTISSAWQRVVSAQCEEAVDGAIDAYSAVAAAERDAAPGAALEVDEMVAAHNTAVSRALSTFDANAIASDAGGPGLVAFRERVVTAAAEKFEQRCKENARASKAACDALLAESADADTLCGELRDAVAADAAAAAAADDADGARDAAAAAGAAVDKGESVARALRAHGACVDRARAAFAARARGPAKWECFAEWERTVGVRLLVRAMDDVQAAFRGRARALQRAERERAQEVAVLSAKMDEVARIGDDEKRALEAAMGEAARRSEIERRRLAELLEAKETEVKRVFDMRNLVVEAYTTQVEELKQQVAEERAAGVAAATAAAESATAAAQAEAASGGGTGGSDHFDLLKEHLDVTRDLLRQKEAEHDEVEYQHGVAKARVAELQSGIYASGEEQRLMLKVMGKLYSALGRRAPGTVKGFSDREAAVLKQAISGPQRL